MGRRNPRVKISSEVSASPTWCSRANTHWRMSMLQSNNQVLVPPPSLGIGQHSLEIACLLLGAAKDPEDNAPGSCQLPAHWAGSPLREIWEVFRHDSQRHLGQEETLCPKAIPTVAPLCCWKYCEFPKSQNPTF